MAGVDGDAVVVFDAGIEEITEVAFRMKMGGRVQALGPASLEGQTMSASCLAIQSYKPREAA